MGQGLGDPKMREKVDRGLKIINQHVAERRRRADQIAKSSLSGPDLTRPVGDRSADNDSGEMLTQARNELRIGQHEARNMKRSKKRSFGRR